MCWLELGSSPCESRTKCRWDDKDKDVNWINDGSSLEARREEELKKNL